MFVLDLIVGLKSEFALGQVQIVRHSQVEISRSKVVVTEVVADLLFSSLALLKPLQKIFQVN